DVEIDDDRHCGRPLNDLRLIFSHFRCRLENMGKREEETGEDHVKQILWQKIVVTARRDWQELADQDASGHDAHEHAHDHCGYPGEASAAQPKGSVDGEDAPGEISASEPPNANDDGPSDE